MAIRALAPAVPAAQAVACAASSAEFPHSSLKAKDSFLGLFSAMHARMENAPSIPLASRKPAVSLTTHETSDRCFF
jgi:hypothetical protein